MRAPPDARMPVVAPTCNAAETVTSAPGKVPAVDNAGSVARRTRFFRCARVVMCEDKLVGFQQKGGGTDRPSAAPNQKRAALSAHFLTLEDDVTTDEENDG